MVVFFETSWAILSIIGLANALYGLIIISITSLSPIILVLIGVSAAGSVANGLCYYAFYTDASPTSSAVASGCADMLWMVQEVGISLYGYLVLNRLLSHRSKRVFRSLFWLTVLAIFILRVFILLSRLKIILYNDVEQQSVVNRLHIGYFALIAILEIICAFFLLRKFASARKLSRAASLNVNLLQHLMRGTEIRLASLSLIGIARAVTYFSQPSVAVASTPSSQIDRFIYALECAFPIMLYIDILASRIKFTDKEQPQMPRLERFRSGQTHPPGQDHRNSVWHDVAEDDDFEEPQKHSRKGSLAEQNLVSRPPAARTQSSTGHGITKTVEFNMYDTSARGNLTT